jgi:hypothetical protein
MWIANGFSAEKKRQTADKILPDAGFRQQPIGTFLT